MINAILSAAGMNFKQAAEAGGGFLARTPDAPHPSAAENDAVQSPPALGGMLKRRFFRID
jgi:hypothetical protein